MISVTTRRMKVTMMGMNEQMNEGKVGAHIHTTPAAIAAVAAAQAAAQALAPGEGAVVGVTPRSNEGASTSNRTGVSKSQCAQMRWGQHKQVKTSRPGREWQA